MKEKEYSELAAGLCSMGCAIISCGGEIYRAEDSMLRIAAAYQVPAEVFVMPNCAIVTLTDEEGHQITRVQRTAAGTTDISRLESLNALSRSVCAAPFGDAGQLAREIKNILDNTPSYSLLLQVLGYALGAYCFCIYCSGSWFDSIFAAIAAVVAGTATLLMTRAKVNFFINLLASSCVLGLVVYGFRMAGIPLYLKGVVSGAIMILVPGLAFTSFMTNMLSEDVISGVAIFAKTILTAVGLALGSGTAFSLFTRFSDLFSTGKPVIYGPLLLCIVTFLSCLGFIPCFNVRGTVGTLLCCIGGTLAFAVLYGAQRIGYSEYFATFLASVTVSFYSQICARMRHFPVTTYLVISYLPLVPGLRIYQAMTYYTQSNLYAMANTVFETIAISTCIAIGTLLVSTVVKIILGSRNKLKTSR